MSKRILGALLRLLRLFLGSGAGRVVILPPTNAGSLGDQAMLDSLSHQLVHTHGKTPVLVTRHGDDMALRNPVEMAFVDGPGLWGKWRALRQILRAEALIFIGADVIDGAYGGDCKRLVLLDMAARAGLRTAAAGFSFSEKPGATAVARLKDMPPMPMHPRDPVSMQRFMATIGDRHEMHQVADLALLVTPEARAETARKAVAWATEQREKGHVVLGLNAGGTTLSKFKVDGVQVLTEMLEAWLRANDKRSALLVPHDYRPQPVGDVEPLRTVLERMPPELQDRVYMVDFPFDAWDAKAIAGALDFALLARMHFAIACLGQGTPPLCVTYAGKFEGLMQHFDLQNMLLSNEEAVSPEALLARLETFEADAPKLRSHIQERLSAVQDLSRKNLAWL